MPLIPGFGLPLDFLTAGAHDTDRDLLDLGPSTGILDLNGQLIVPRKIRGGLLKGNVSGHFQG